MTAKPQKKLIIETETGSKGHQIFHISQSKEETPRSYIGWEKEKAITDYLNNNNK